MDNDSTPAALRLSDQLGRLVAAEMAAYYEGEYMDHSVARARLRDFAASIAAAERERWAPLLRAAGRVLQAFDDGYLLPDPETLQAGIAVDALREAWGAFVPAGIQGPNVRANATDTAAGEA